MHWDYAINRLLTVEGGYSNHQSDSGGETKYGISKRSYPQLDIAHLTTDQAKRIYHRDYWQPNNLDFIADKDLAAEILSLVVNIGSARGATILQETLRSLGADIDADGRIGLKTASACNEFYHGEYLLSELKLRIIKWYAEHSQSVFLRGLINRILA